MDSSFSSCVAYTTTKRWLFVRSLNLVCVGPWVTWLFELVLRPFSSTETPRFFFWLSPVLLQVFFRLSASSPSGAISFSRAGYLSPGTNSLFFLSCFLLSVKLFRTFCLSFIRARSCYDRLPAFFFFFYLGSLSRTFSAGRDSPFPSLLLPSSSIRFQQPLDFRFPTSPKIFIMKDRCNERTPSVFPALFLSFFALLLWRDLDPPPLSPYLKLFPCAIRTLLPL